MVALGKTKAAESVFPDGVSSREYRQIAGSVDKALVCRQEMAEESWRNHLQDCVGEERSRSGAWSAAVVLAMPRASELSTNCAWRQSCQASWLRAPRHCCFHAWAKKAQLSLHKGTWRNHGPAQTPIERKRATDSCLPASKCRALIRYSGVALVSTMSFLAGAATNEKDPPRSQRLEPRW